MESHPLPHYKAGSTHTLLMGGLGNQLFQLAFSLYAARGGEITLEDWLGNTRRNSLNQPDLACLKLPQNVRLKNIPDVSLTVRRLINLGLRLGSDPKTSRLLVTSYEFLSSRILRILQGPSPITFAHGLGFDRSFTSNSRQEYYCGYLQTFRYASDPQVLNELKQLRPLNQAHSLAKTDNVSSAIMLHVRLTDYVNQKHFGTLGTSYYLTGIKQLFAELGERPIHIYTDDPEIALSYLPRDYSSHYVLQPKLEDVGIVFEAMRNHSGYLIANSSLSWWAAFLRHQDQAPVIAPQPWFRGIPSPTDLLPLDWRKLDSWFRED